MDDNQSAAAVTSERRRINLTPGAVLNAFARMRELTLLAIILLTVLVMTNANQYFLTPANFRAMAIGFAPTAIISVGMAILLVTHDVEMAASAADRVVLMEDSVIVAEGNPADVLTSAPVEDDGALAAWLR